MAHNEELFQLFPVEALITIENETTNHIVLNTRQTIVAGDNPTEHLTKRHMGWELRPGKDTVVLKRDFDHEVQKASAALKVPVAIAKTTVQGDATHNEVQVIEVHWSSGGTFVVRLGASVTGNLAWNISPASLQTAIRASLVGGANVTVTGTASTGVNAVGTYTVTFIAADADTNMKPLEVDYSLLTGTPNVSVSATFLPDKVTLTNTGTKEVVVDNGMSGKRLAPSTVGYVHHAEAFSQEAVERAKDLDVDDTDLEDAGLTEGAHVTYVDPDAHVFINNPTTVAVILQDIGRHRGGGILVPAGAKNFQVRSAVWNAPENGSGDGDSDLVLSMHRGGPVAPLSAHGKNGRKHGLELSYDPSTPWNTVADDNTDAPAEPQPVDDSGDNIPTPSPSDNVVAEDIPNPPNDGTASLETPGEPTDAQSVHEPSEEKEAAPEAKESTSGNTKEPDTDAVAAEEMVAEGAPVVEDLDATDSDGDDDDSAGALEEHGE